MAQDNNNFIDNIKNDYFEIMDALFETMPHIYWKDRKGVYLGCNLNQAKAFNCTVEEYVGKTAFEILDDQETAKRITAVDNQVMQTGNKITIEETMITPQGDKKVYLSQKMPRYNAKGEIIGLFGFSMDITEIKEQELLAKFRAEQLTKENHELEIYKNLTKQQDIFKKCLDEIQHTIQNYKISILNNKLGINSSKINNLDQGIKLTRREQEILYYLSLNKSPKDIAIILTTLENKKVSDSTINAIINKKLYPKFDVFNIAQLIEKATSLKLIPFILDNLNLNSK